jgi:hypothetical protein
MHWCGYFIFSESDLVSEHEKEAALGSNMTLKNPNKVARLLTKIRVSMPVWTVGEV